MGVRQERKRLGTTVLELFMAPGQCGIELKINYDSHVCHNKITCQFDQKWRPLIQRNKIHQALVTQTTLVSGSIHFWLFVGFVDKKKKYRISPGLAFKLFLCFLLPICL